MLVAYEGRCLICSNEHEVCDFFDKPWSSPTYRWDIHEDLNKMKCPSCGANVPNSLGRRIANFLKEMAYDHH